MVRSAIIGGTGFSGLPAEFAVTEERVSTPFGDAAVVHIRGNGIEYVFVPRHGESHSIPPHRINYRANIAALARLGVQQVFATNAVGSLRQDLPPGSLVLLNDFIDFTRARPLSYFDGAGDAGIVHTDFTEPYCPRLRDTLLEVAADRNVELLPRGVYLCADGPRFETPAEVRLFQQWGADVVGMTGLPEAVFAREAGLCYAAIAIVANFAAGLTDEPVDHNRVVERVRQDAQRVRDLLTAAAMGARPTRTCRCGGSDLEADGDLRPA